MPHPNITSMMANGITDQVISSQTPAFSRLPTWFSAQWQHDSEWSTWPFEISA
jgi:hypothetical protein